MKKSKLFMIAALVLGTVSFESVNAFAKAEPRALACETPFRGGPKASLKLVPKSGRVEIIIHLEKDRNPFARLLLDLRPLLPLLEGKLHEIRDPRLVDVETGARVVFTRHPPAADLPPRLSMHVSAGGLNIPFEGCIYAPVPTL